MNPWRGGTRILDLEPALALKWEQTSPTVWRFHLRPNVKWQDGSAFTADDVVFSLGRILAKSSVMRAPLSVVKEARKIDDHDGGFRNQSSPTRSFRRSKPTS